MHLLGSCWYAKGIIMTKLNGGAIRTLVVVAIQPSVRSSMLKQLKPIATRCQRLPYKHSRLYCAMPKAILQNLE